MIFSYEVVGLVETSRMVVSRTPGDHPVARYGASNFDNGDELDRFMFLVAALTKSIR
jgi:hypothetical protein